MLPWCSRRDAESAFPKAGMAFPVMDGDSHDCRFLGPKGVVVGLRAKGVAKGSKSPFVVIAA